MRIAFHAPLKPPDAPTPSGDRRMARLLIAALRQAGHDVRLASRLRSREPDGNRARQRRIEVRGRRIACALAERARRPGAWVPDLWFTYHLYYKAPDWLGPTVCRELAIPYVVAEASHAGKRATGPWSAWHAAVADALGRADLVIGLNRADRPGVEPALGPGGHYLALRPFIEPSTGPGREDARRALAARHGLDPGRAWLLAVGMMRRDVKLESWRLLGAALERLHDCPDWQLIAAGDGPTRGQVEAALEPETLFTGTLGPDELASWMAAADLCLWPAVAEAYGMALLEAQAAGMAVVAGAAGGVPDIVRNGETGLLVPEGDVAAFAGAVRKLLDDAELRRRMGAAAARAVRARHGLDQASARIDAALAQTVRRFRSRRAAA
ncbi:MAG: glycosyltransferase family 4 protein [Alphaproteobacteria bacterium]|nr:glycosyltransferase family 4 protein [Alphaproteobacteria bacterium]